MKKVLSFILAAVLLMSISVCCFADGEMNEPNLEEQNEPILNEIVEGQNGLANVPADYVSDENGLVAYYIDDDSFDVQGYVAGSWRSTTYNDYGHEIYLRLGNKYYYVDDFSGETPVWYGYDGTPDRNTGIYVKAEPVIVADGKLLHVAITVENRSGRTYSDMALAVFADAEFNLNDDCAIIDIGEPGDASMFALEDTAENGNEIYFVVAPVNADATVYDDWHNFNYAADKFRAGEKGGLEEETDSAYAFSWARKLVNRAKKVFNALFGIGDLDDIQTAIAGLEFDPEEPDPAEKTPFFAMISEDGRSIILVPIARGAKAAEEDIVLKADGEKVDHSCFDFTIDENGKITITFTNEYFASLAAGRHSIVVKINNISYKLRLEK